MKHFVLAVFLCFCAPSLCFSQEADDIKWSNYFGIGGSIEIENVDQDHSAFQMSAAVSRRIFPHAYLMFQLGYYPFSDGNLIVEFGPGYYEILTAGLAARIGTARGGHGPSVYALFGSGWTALQNINNCPYYSAGAGFETSLRTRLGVYLQAQYFSLNAADRTFKFVALSCGISFSPKL